MSKLSQFARTHFTLRGKKKFLMTAVGVIAAGVAAKYPDTTPILNYLIPLLGGYIGLESVVDVTRAVSNK